MDSSTPVCFHVVIRQKFSTFFCSGVTAGVAWRSDTVLTEWTDLGADGHYGRNALEHVEEEPAPLPGVATIRLHNTVEGTALVQGCDTDSATLR